MIKAAPWKPADNDTHPNIAQEYPHYGGTHGIPGESETHTGDDLVMKAGNSGVYQQWFYGESDTEGTHGEHSVWNPAGPNGCPDGWTFIADPHNKNWGGHFEAGVDYCVKTNDFGPFN